MHTVSKRILVVGATGGSGRQAVERLLSTGRAVTAFSRHADAIQPMSDRLRTVNGDVMNPADVERAVEGHDAVIVALGVSENPMRVRLFGSARTPIDVRSAGTRNVVAAMKKHGLRRLVVQTTYGIGESKEKLRWIERLLFKVLLEPQIRDSERQETVVRESGLDWVLVQPVHLTDAVDDRPPFLSLDGETRKMQVSRGQVARFLVEAVESSAYVGKSVAVSGP